MKAILEDERLGFASAHFSKKNGHWYLHGHNFQLRIELEVEDYDCMSSLFHDVRGKLKKFDHVVFVPASWAHVENTTVNVELNGMKFAFPREDCILVDASDTSLKQILSLTVTELKQHYDIKKTKISVDGLVWIEYDTQCNL